MDWFFKEKKILKYVFSFQMSSNQGNASLQIRRKVWWLVMKLTTKQKQLYQHHQLYLNMVIVSYGLCLIIALPAVHSCSVSLDELKSASVLVPLFRVAGSADSCCSSPRSSSSSSSLQSSLLFLDEQPYECTYIVC